MRCLRGYSRLADLSLSVLTVRDMEVAVVGNATVVSCHGIHTVSFAMGIAQLNVDAVFEIEDSTNQIWMIVKKMVN